MLTEKAVEVTLLERKAISRFERYVVMYDSEYENAFCSIYARQSVRGAHDFATRIQLVLTERSSNYAKCKRRHKNVSL